MINLKVPDWWDSIRAIIAITLVVTFCVCMFASNVSADKLGLLEKATFTALIFYYTLKRRKEGE